MNDLSKISFAKAQSILKNLGISQDLNGQVMERTLLDFAISCFIKKRLNNILLSLQSLSKLSDKSHYRSIMS